MYASSVVSVVQSYKYHVQYRRDSNCAHYAQQMLLNEIKKHVKRGFDEDCAKLRELSCPRSLLIFRVSTHLQHHEVFLIWNFSFAHCVHRNAPVFCV